MAKTVQQAFETMDRNLLEKTGKSLELWVRIAAATGLAKHGEIVKHLKAAHGLGHGYANRIALQALPAASGASPPAGDDLVAAQYAGGRAALRPIYDALIAAIRKFGGDVEISPKKTYVSLRRSKQFGLIQPSTATRLDVGVNLKGTPPGKRLEASGSFNAMVSHRVRVASRSEVDAELIGWLRKAYESA